MPHPLARSPLTVVAAAVLLTLAVIVGGCGPKTLQSAWPLATSEQAVPNPNDTPTWPLTGMPAPSFAAVTVRVVSVKIDNAVAARPQTGLGEADIVYETLTEGGVTRYNALFQSHTPALVGPVRSARPSDLALVTQYDALFAHVGGASSLRRQLADTTVYDDLDALYVPGPFSRVTYRAAPHNAYLSLTALRTAAVRRSYAATASITGLAFAGTVATATPTVTSLTIPFSGADKASWTYAAASTTYLRSVNGKRDTDRATGEQLSARNVVVLWTRTSTYGSGGALNEVTLTGSGRASVFLGGQRYDGTWSAGASSPPVLREQDGRIIRLDPGDTWFEVIGNDAHIVMN